MYQLAVIISLALVVDSNSIVRTHCGSPGTNPGLLERLLCVSESIRTRADELIEGEVDPYAERQPRLKGVSAQEPRTAAEILQRAEEVLREGAKAVEQFRRESQKTPKQ